MGAIVNGMVLTKLRAFGAGFLIFSDYGKMPIRLAALMEIPALYVFTHDSIGVGEDGPTHEPIEQLITLRSIPYFITIRPADANEVVEAWRHVYCSWETQPGGALILTRPGGADVDRAPSTPWLARLHKGAYVLADAPDGKPDLILIGTGSEVSLCVDAYEKLKAEGAKVRVVSMPSWELFDHQPAAYRDSVLPPSVTARVSVEMSSEMGWAKYVGLTGAIIGMKTFGASAPLKDLLKKFGFTPERVLAVAREQLARVKR